MKLASAIFLSVIQLTGCTSVWTRYPPESLRDGSRIQLTTWKNQYSKDGLRIDRTTRSGQKSYYYLKRAEADYYECKVLSQSRTGVTLRFSDDTGNALFDREFPYSEFVIEKD